MCQYIKLVLICTHAMMDTTRTPEQTQETKSIAVLSQRTLRYLILKFAVTAGSVPRSLWCFMLYTKAPYVSSHIALSRPPCATFAWPHTSLPSSTTRCALWFLLSNRNSMSLMRPVFKKAVNCNNPEIMMFCLDCVVHVQVARMCSDAPGVVYTQRHD